MGSPTVVERRKFACTSDHRDLNILPEVWAAARKPYGRTGTGVRVADDERAVGLA